MGGEEGDLNGKPEYIRLGGQDNKMQTLKAWGMKTDITLGADPERKTKKIMSLFGEMKFPFWGEGEGFWSEGKEGA